MVENHIVYSRRGGYFVTTKKALIYLVITAALSIAVGLLVYQYGPRKDKELVISKPENIQELLDKTLKNIPVQDIRLPEHIKPIHYKLKLQPSIENSTFSGEVSIVIQCTQKAKIITFNVDRLELHNITLLYLHEQDESKRRNVNEVKRNASREEPKVSKMVKRDTESMIGKNETLDNVVSTSPATTTTTVSPQATEFTTVDYVEKVPNVPKKVLHDTPMPGHMHIYSRQINAENFQYELHLAKILLPGKTYLLTIVYSGKISESLQGLHKSNYVNSEGKTVYTLVSHMQPVFARRVFPCFDEPSMKATFEISIVRQENMASLSNMPLKESNWREDGWIEDHFQTTPPMPTYLVAIILLDLDYASTRKSDTNISIWAPNEHLSYATYALTNTVKIIDYFNEYFNITYMLPKLDIVALPTLLSTATENWGLIFFRESLLLNGIYEKEIVYTLAKKLAQQWFGNLVSVQWWNDLWQVKGFALLMAEEAAVKIHNWTSEFTLRITQKMLALDDFQSAPKLEIDIKNTLQIKELFDSVTHYKGSCILRMLKDSVPADLFRKSIQSYLKKWQFKSASQFDLWKSISNNTKEYLTAGTNISQIMETWTSQTGYPLITVARDEAKHVLTISQRKFQAANESDNSLWIVPLNYIIGNDDVRKTWLTNRSITLHNVSSDKWILFNIKRTGYYRVNYDIDNWNLLVKVLNTSHEAIPIENRGQLINDAFKLAENGLLDYKIPFALTTYLHRETNYIPWASVLDSLQFLKRILQSTYLNGAYEEYIANLVSAVYDKIENSTSIDTELKKLIVETACDVNYQPCIHWAKKSFLNWMNDKIDLPYDLRQTIFCSVIKTGGKKEWNFLWNQIKLQTSNSDIEELFMSLGCTKDIWLINKYMRNALTGEIPWQYVPYVWKSLSQPTSTAFGFKYLRENWNIIYHTYKDKPIIMKAIVKDFLFALSSKSDLEDLTLLVSNHEEDLQELASLIQGVVDRIKIRVLWAHKYLTQMEQLLPH